VPESKVISLDKRAEDEEKPFLEQLLQEGARKLLQAAIENEVMDYIQFHKDRRDENGQRLVVRNGHLPEREIVSRGVYSGENPPCGPGDPPHGTGRPHWPRGPDGGRTGHCLGPHHHSSLGATVRPRF
jgi:hypothetical protein